MDRPTEKATLKSDQPSRKNRNCYSIREDYDHDNEEEQEVEEEDKEEEEKEEEVEEDAEDEQKVQGTHKDSKII